MNKLAIIPARGGSKRIHRKNINDFLGKPIIAYSIEAAIESQLFDEIMVSTDDLEIAEIAIRYGAKVPFMRSDKNADDRARTSDVLTEVLEKYKEIKNIVFQYGCCIYPTAPFITPKHLKIGFEKLESQGLDSVFPIVEFSYPIWRGLTISNNNVNLLWPEYSDFRSQDLDKVYHDAGQWYWFNSRELFRQDRLFMQNSGYVEINESEVQDIDTETDWNLAMLKYKARKFDY